MAKKKGNRGGKDKGKSRHGGSTSGMSRLRRANEQSRVRSRNLERYAEDEDLVETLAGGRESHSGESLLAKFNRLARDHDAGEGREGAVTGFEGPIVLVRDAEGTEHPCVLRQVLKKMLAGEKSPLCAGDRVRFRPPGEGEEEGVIVAMLPRDNQLERADSHNKALVHVFAANVGVLMIVASLREPEIQSGLIDRYLVIAHAADIDPVIVLNKRDLAEPEPWASLYRDLGYDVYATDCSDPESGGRGDVGPLLARIRGRDCVFAGKSGAGKSSLIRTLFPGSAARIGDVSAAHGKGRHTTNASRSYPLGDGTVLIDTPGIRECGITGMEPLDVALLYRDLAALHEGCRFSNCTHLHEPGCAVQAAVEAGELPVERYLSYCSIVEEDLG